MAINYNFEIGRKQNVLSESLKELDSREFLKKMWQKDGTVWTADPRHHVIAANRLGWLHLPGLMKPVVDELERFAQNKVFRKVKHIVHLGMGGSSLAPEVFYKVFGNAADYPELLVLDSTDPDFIFDVMSKIEIDSTLFIVASKSGTTVETRSLARFFYDKLTSDGIEGVADHFLAITDAGTPLEAEGKSQYGHVFVNPSDIGGRYSALSYFGLVPFTLLGRDLGRFLEESWVAEEQSSSDVSLQDCDALKLGALLGKLASVGRNKLTIETSSRLSGVGSWIEQLVAESTGKEGKGILPITSEEITAPPFYSGDRVFVYMKLKGDIELGKEEKLNVLRKNGFPVVEIELEDVYELGHLFYDWEIATAAAASVLGIDPFDEPSVKESKDNTKQVLDNFKSTGKVQLDSAPILETPIAAFGNVEASNRIKGILNNLFTMKRTGDYLAIMAYLSPRSELDEVIENLRTALRDRLKIAVTVGYGPRFLHSTGQFHKGGTPNGLFLQLVHDPVNDYRIPGEEYSFATLLRAQAIGDYMSLKSKGKPVVSLMLGKDPLSRVTEILAEIS